MAETEMVERVALSLFNLDGREDWEPCALAVKDHYRTQARAAIEAMREPSDAVFHGLYGVEARRQFTDMIDAALTPPSP